MNIRKLILVSLLLLMGALGFATTNVAVPAPSTTSGKELTSFTDFVEPLTPQQQAQIDNGLTSSTTTVPYVRPETYVPGKQNCFERLEPIQPGEKLSKVVEFRCFDSFQAALAASTDGKLQVSPNFRPDDLTQEMLDAANVDTLLGIDYVDANYVGGTYQWLTAVNIAGCTDGSGYGDNVDPAWNDTFSSARGYQGCKMNHYEHINYGGAMLSCAQSSGGCSYMGAMNDQTSSVNLVS